ncbi:DedA family protein [Candidatus Daviesbacteria bacterium]|nr:DedA family protein [Candidatus Daviesbacteria bacterium]
MLESIAQWIIHVISTLGYPGIVLTMAIESALIPLPSEIIMPFSGFLVSTGQFNIHLAAISGAVGNLIGSLIAYAIGFWGQEAVVRKFIKNYGKWILVTEKELDMAEKLMNKYEDSIVLISRILPGVRTIISLPAGIAHLPILRFIILTFVGSLVWSYFLAYIGFALGEHWNTLGVYFHSADAIIGLGLALLVGFYIYHKTKH